MDLDFITFA